jgi:rod shape determining protein RodA
LKRSNRISGNLDPWLVFFYFFLVVFGWANIYSSSSTEESREIFNMSTSHGKQLLWMGICFGLAFFIMLFDSRFYTNFWYIFYGGVIILLALVLVVGQKVDGNRSWFVISSAIKIQPSEFAKFTTALIIAKLISAPNFSFEPTSKSHSLIRKFSTIPVLNATADGVLIFVGLLVPSVLILLEGDTGSTMVFLSFVLAFFRFGLSWLYFITGVIMVIVFFMTILFPVTYVLIGLLLAGIVVGFFITDLRNGWKGSLLMLLFFLMALVLPGIFAGWFPKIEVDAKTLEPIIKGYPAWMPPFLPPILPALLTITVMMVFAVVSFFFRRMIGGAGTILAIFIFLVSFTLLVKPIYNNVLKPHHRTRVMVLLGKETDRKGAAWNVYNSKVAIGSGGFLGKGYLHGSFTKLKFIPKQRTDFIFSVVGEEWGFWGSTLVLLIYLAFLIRLVLAADRQRNKFHMVYGYCVACLMFFHYFMNVGTTIGLAPAVGVPLPFFSYGGSSLLGFTILLWVFVKMDSQNMQILR